MKGVINNEINDNKKISNEIYGSDTFLPFKLPNEEQVFITRETEK